MKQTYWCSISFHSRTSVREGNWSVTCEDGDQMADIFTKPLNINAFWKFTCLLGMIDGREFGLGGSASN